MRNVNFRRLIKSFSFVCTFYLCALCIQKTQAQCVSTFSGTGVGNVDGPSNIGQVTPSFKSPSSVVIDASGNMYICDQGNNTVRKMTPSGVVSTLAGSGVQGNTDGSGATASFYSPSGIAIDGSGNIYVADRLNNKIRKITPAGVVSTFAGSGVQGSTDGSSTTASFYGPTGVAVDGSGNVYVADQGNHKIRKITSAGVVSTFAGIGTAGSTDGAVASSSFKSPSGVAVDIAGNVYVADMSNYKVRKITGGIVSTLAGSGTMGNTDGIGVAASFYLVFGICVDVTGNVYVVDNANKNVRKITATGVVSTLAGSGLSGSLDGVGILASFNYPTGITVDASGNIYIADQGNHKIRKIAATGVVSTFIGIGISGNTDGTGIAASLNFPSGVAIDASGNVYVAERYNHQIRKITPFGVVSTFAGSGTTGSIDGISTVASFAQPAGVAVDASGNVYVADLGNHKIRKITSTGVVSTLAGTGTQGSTDGTGTAASFNFPTALAVDASGNLYVVDQYGGKVRKITPGGVVTTLAGDGVFGGSADGIGTAASFNSLLGVAVDASGNVYVGDTGNHKIRKITASGVVSTLAGSGTAGSADGVGTAASFNQPQGVAVDALGNVYVADFYNHKIRKITPTGVVSTLAGTGTAGSTDGLGTTASFNQPSGIAVDPYGNLYIADTRNNKIRAIINTPIFTQVAPICSGDVLSALPTTSINGITGTWSPAINNSATTTYTFTSAVGQCPTTATMSIVVNQKMAPTFAVVSAICSGDVLAALPTTSINGITGTWSPAINNTLTTTYTFTPTAGQCATTTTMAITVNQKVVPTFTQVAQICSGSTLVALPTTSINGITGTWSPAINNTLTTTYTFTPAAGQCATTTTMVITVDQKVTPAFTQVAQICSGSTLAALPTTSINGITGTWSPAINNTLTTTYTFTPATGQCATTTTMAITVNQKVTPTFTQVATICSGESLVALPTTSTNGITGTWSPTINNTLTTTYTFTPTAGQCATTATMAITVNQKIVPTFTQVASICPGAALAALPTTSINGITGIWSPGINNTNTTTYTFTPTAGQCAALQTMQIIVNTNVIPAFTQVSSICSGEMLIALPTTSINGIVGTWSPAINNSVTTTYVFAPAAGQCATATTMTIAVAQKVAPTFTQVASICSGGVLTALPTISNNGIAGTWTPAINNTATTTYTFTPTIGQCATSNTMQIVVNAKVIPTFASINVICSGETLATLPTISTNGITGTWSPVVNNATTTTYAFTPTVGQCATNTNIQIAVNAKVVPTFASINAICSGEALAALPTTSINGITGSWTPSINNSATTTYTFTPATGQCATSTTMQIVVNAKTIPTFASVSPVCSGSVLADLPTTSINGITGTWSPTIDNTFTTTYTFTPTVGQCATPTVMQLAVNAKIIPTFIQVAAICSGTTLADLPSTSMNGIVGTWSPAINNTATTTYTFTPNATSCSSATTMTITVNDCVTSINGSISTNEMKAYTYDKIVYIKSTNPIVKIAISDITGSIVYKGSADIIDLVREASGIYIVMVETTEGFANYKLIIE